jgi:transposase InsO family protein
VQSPFQQWGIDFIGEISCKSSGGHSWILVATDYFTKWVEAIPTKKANSKFVIDFLMNNVVTRFVCPERIVFDNAMCFWSEEYTKFCKKHGIKISYSSPYHPQRNRQAESSNKSLLKIIKRILGQNKKAWDSKLRLVV